MGLTNEQVGLKILAKIKIYVLIRAELLFPLCYEIPCIIKTFDSQKFKSLNLISLIISKFPLPVSQPVTNI